MGYGKVEEIKAVGMRCCKLRFGWVGGWMGGLGMWVGGWVGGLSGWVGGWVGGGSSFHFLP